jgi:hypothetical protein
MLFIHPVILTHSTGFVKMFQLHTLRCIKSAWKAIDIGWNKVDFGFKTVEVLAPHQNNTAREFFHLTDNFRNLTTLDAKETAVAYIVVLRLAVRAFSGLLPRGLDKSDDLERLRNLIDSIPSNGERAGIWAELALYYYASDRSEECKKIVATYINPCLVNLTDDKEYRNNVIVSIAPALYFAHRLTGIEEISNLPFNLRDDAFANVCDFILRKQPISDPYNHLSGQGYKITYEEIIDICELVNLMESDWLIYHYIETISDCLSSSRWKDRS